MVQRAKELHEDHPRGGWVKGATGSDLVLNTGRQVIQKLANRASEPSPQILIDLGHLLAKRLLRGDAFLSGPNSV